MWDDLLKAKQSQTLIGRRKVMVRKPKESAQTAKRKDIALIVVVISALVVSNITVLVEEKVQPVYRR